MRLPPLVSSRVTTRPRRSSSLRSTDTLCPPHVLVRQLLRHAVGAAGAVQHTRWAGRGYLVGGRRGHDGEERAARQQLVLRVPHTQTQAAVSSPTCPRCAGRAALLAAQYPHVTLCCLAPHTRIPSLPPGTAPHTAHRSNSPSTLPSCLPSCSPSPSRWLQGRKCKRAGRVLSSFVSRTKCTTPGRHMVAAP